jgi:hypothetical protein
VRGADECVAVPIGIVDGAHDQPLEDRGDGLHAVGDLARIEATLRSVGAVDEHDRLVEVPPGWKSRQQGAATSVLLAASPLVRGVTGRYVDDCNEAVVATEPGDLSGGVALYALDQNDADRLWDETTRLLQR